MCGPSVPGIVLLTEDPLFSSARGSHFHRVTEAPGHCAADPGVWSEVKEDGGVGRGWVLAQGLASDPPSGERWHLRLFQPCRRAWTQLGKGPCRLERSTDHTRWGQRVVLLYPKRSRQFCILLSLTDVSCFNIEMLQVFQLTLAKCSCVLTLVPMEPLRQHLVRVGQGFSTPHTDNCSHRQPLPLLLIRR